MNTKIYSFISAIIIGLAFASCSEEWGPKDSDKGQLKLSSLGIDIDAGETIITRSEINLNPFIITIYNKQDAIVEKWTFQDMPEIISLPVGEYTLLVRSYELEKISWDKTYYEGQTDFSITAGKITNIGKVKCTPQALKVSVLFDDELKNQLNSDIEVTIIAGDNASAIFTPNTTGSAFFAIDKNNDKNTLIAFFTGTINGYHENIHKEFSGVKPGQHYKVSFFLRSNPLEPDPDTGLIDPSDGVNVDIDITHDENQNGSIDNSEEIIQGDKDHDNEEFVEEVNTKYDGTSKTLQISAASGLKSVIVKAEKEINNEEFNTQFADLIEGVDLAITDVKDKYGLSKVLENSVSLELDFSTLYTMAEEFEGNHKFMVTATDIKGSSCEPVEIIVKGKSSGSEAIIFESKLSFDTPMNPSDYSDGLVTISAPAGIKNLYLYIETTSDDPLFKGIVDVLSGKDIANPDEETAKELDVLELANGPEVLNKDQVNFDISSFLPLLTDFDGTHKFTIVVTDNDDNSNSITLTFEVNND